MKSLNKNKQGLVSITVVIVIMIIVTMIVLAFASMIRREQRQSLDRQLNTQAFYAAEAGINDAVNAIKSNAALATFDSGGDCSSFNTAASLTPALGDGTTSYSCLLVDTSADSLVYDEVGTSQSQVVLLQKKSTDPNIDTIKIAWQDVQGNSDFGGCPSGTTNTFSVNWPATCSPGVMRVDIVPFNGPKSRELLISDSGVVYLVPKDGLPGATSVAFGTFGGSNLLQGLSTSVECDAAATPRHCVATITGLSIATGYLRLKSIYKPSAVTVIALNGGAGGTVQDLLGAQAIIDVTGKANDVLKRVQVRVPLSTSDPVSEFAVESASTVCKRLISNGTTVLPDIMATFEPDCDPSQSTAN